MDEQAILLEAKFFIDFYNVTMDQNGGLLMRKNVPIQDSFIQATLEQRNGIHEQTIINQIIKKIKEIVEKC